MDQLDEIGYKACAVYYTQLQERYNLGQRENTTYFNHQHQRNFRKIAELCIVHRFNVTDFVTQAFDLIAKNHKYITPKDLTTPILVEKYKDYCRGAVGDCKRSHMIQLHLLMDLCERLIPQKFTTEEELLNEFTFPFDSWFRLLHPMPFNEMLFDHYGERAWLELHADRRLRKYIKNEYPENTAELERRLGAFPAGEVEL